MLSLAAISELTCSPLSGTAGAAVTAAGSTMKDGLAGSAAGNAKAGNRKLLKEPRAVKMVKDRMTVGFN